MKKNKLIIGIIGGGFSGVMLAANLIKQTSRPVEIYLIEKSIDRLARGVAYSTTCSRHLLNVMAFQMGAFEQDVGGFYRWVVHHKKEWQEIDSYLNNLELSPYSFLPRRLYGMYLEQTLESVKNLATKKSVPLHLMHKEVLDVSLNTDNQFIIEFSDHEQIQVNQLVLATGVPLFKKFHFENSSLVHDPHYIQDFWGTQKQFKEKIEGKKSVVILGTGLTAIDALASLVDIAYKGKIYCLSKHGKFPELHAIKPSPKIKLLINKNIKKSAQLLIRYLRKKIKKVGKENWRFVIDALRPISSDLWKGLTLVQKKRFLRHFFSHWNKFRHRMSPESSEMIARLKKKGQLVSLCAKIVSIESDVHNLRVNWVERGESSPNSLPADCVINCSGPEYQLVKQKDNLIVKLINKGLIEADPLKMGLQVSDNGKVKSINRVKIYTLGSLCFGSEFETIAVPELRRQAYNLAKSILNN